MWEIVGKIEAAAFYDGYHLALGLGGGPCKTVFCPKIDCVALTPGKACPYNLKVRSSMEGVGIDVYRMAARAGWDIYPCGMSLKPEDLPHGRRMSMVMIY